MESKETDPRRWCFSVRVGYGPNLLRETRIWGFAQPDTITTVVPYVNLVFGTLMLCRSIVAFQQRNLSDVFFLLVFIIFVSVIFQLCGNSLPVVMRSQGFSYGRLIVSCLS